MGCEAATKVTSGAEARPSEGRRIRKREVPHRFALRNDTPKGYFNILLEVKLTMSAQSTHRKE
jgi:hypothetical protein